MKKVKNILMLLAGLMVLGMTLASCDMGDNIDDSDDHVIPLSSIRYATVPYKGGSSGGGIPNLVYSARDNTNNYYLFLLGHIDFVPISYRPAIIYNGQTPITIGYSSSSVNETSISRAVEDTNTHSVIRSQTYEWEIKTEAGFEAGWFSAKISASVGGSTGWSETNTRSVSNTLVTASSWSTGETDSYDTTIGNKDEPPGKYRFSLFATTDVYYVLVTNRARTQVTSAYTSVCARPESYGWGIDYEPDMNGSFAKTGDDDLLRIPAIVLSQLPEPTDIYDGSILLPDGKSYEIDLRGRTSFTISISGNANRAVITGGSNEKYTESEIIVEERSSPLVIEFINVHAVGKKGSNGKEGQNGSNGRPLISMGSSNARVPDLTIISSGNSNILYGGSGGNGGQGYGNSNGARGGHGGTAIMANKITIMGSSTITLSGGNGGNGGRGGDLGISPIGTSGGNGGNGGASVNANDITINISGIISALKSKGGNGGSSWHGSTGLGIIGGSDGSSGAQGVQFTSTPNIVNGTVIDR